MVYVVVLRGTEPAVAPAKQQLIASSNGWKSLGNDVYLVGQEEAHPETLRNFMRRHPGVEVAVMQLNGSWASGGCQDLANWLRAAENMLREV